MIEDLDKAIAYKDGAYITDFVEEDEIGKTRIITNEDMKLVKNVAQNLANKSTYDKYDRDLPKIQQAFFDKNLKKINKNLIKYIILTSIVLITIFAILIGTIIVDSRRESQELISTSSIINNMKNSLVNIDYDVANNVMREYGIELNIVSYEFDDNVARGSIIRVLDNSTNSELSSGDVLDVVVSDGSYVIDFTDVDSLNKITLVEMTNMLSKRNIEFTTSEINDLNVPRGYIIGANKANTSQPGNLILTVSRGISDSYIAMPDLYGMTLEDAVKKLEDNNLALGNVSFKRNYVLDKDLVMEQSVVAGDEVKTGTVINISLSVGRFGDEIIVPEKNYWYSNFSTTFRLGQNIIPTGGTNDTIILQVRLVQTIGTRIVYTELMEPAEYRIGTTIPLVFESIRGEENIRTGKLQVVDVVNDRVLASYDLLFQQKY